ncbi:hypothetical protein NTGBS_440031 [Candidatus Nitrotoga sp. BS]|nr:hypothetical protein NTGBS_440031 [Candidatus Nitrotoga sp. BS]
MLLTAKGRVAENIVENLLGGRSSHKKKGITLEVILPLRLCFLQNYLL